MSEEILEQQSEEELEEQQAVAESSDEEVVEAKLSLKKWKTKKKTRKRWKNPLTFLKLKQEW